MGNWERTLRRETAIWLRFYDVAGNLVLLPDEAATVQAQAAILQVEVAAAKAARLATRLRELGENPDIL